MMSAKDELYAKVMEKINAEYTLNDIEKNLFLEFFEALFKKTKNGPKFRQSPEPNPHLFSMGNFLAENFSQFKRHGIQKLFLYHKGKFGNNLGTLFFLHSHFDFIAEYSGLLPHPEFRKLNFIQQEKDENYYKFTNENAKAGRDLFDKANFFVMMIRGMTSTTPSVPGDAWQRVLR